MTFLRIVIPLYLCLSMIFSENRCPLFRIMLKLTSEFPDDFFGREFGFRLGRGIIRRHETGCCLAPDESAGLSIRGYGRAPMSRSALVSNNRKLRYLSHIASKSRPRALYAAMSKPMGLSVPRPICEKNINRRPGVTGHCGI